MSERNVLIYIYIFKGQKFTDAWFKLLLLFVLSVETKSTMMPHEGSLSPPSGKTASHTSLVRKTINGSAARLKSENKLVWSFAWILSS